VSGITEKEKEILGKLLKKHGSNRTEHFNGLSEAEQERLSILAEECGEVVQIVGKILRHGYESFNPDDTFKTTNRSLLTKEIGDVAFITSFMVANGDIKSSTIEARIREKGKKIKQYFHHQENKEDENGQ